MEEKHYLDYSYHMNFEEDYKRWDFRIDCRLDNGFQVATVQGFFFNELYELPDYLWEEAFDENSNDGYELFHELEAEGFIPEKLLLIKALWVDSTFRNKGIATDVLNHMKKAFENHNLYLMPAPIQDKNMNRDELRSFYEKREFETIRRYMKWSK